jgi:hypothetical protein
MVLHIQYIRIRLCNDQYFICNFWFITGNGTRCALVSQFNRIKKVIPENTETCREVTMFVKNRFKIS